MKFCKNLQKVVDISDPEWAPYWTNYKMLKKLIKELPSLVPADDVSKTCVANRELQQGEDTGRPGSPSSVASSTTGSSVQHQQRGDKTAEGATAGKHCRGADALSATARNLLRDREHTDTNVLSAEPEAAASLDDQKRAIGKSPGEIAFFKLLYSELKKAEHFFERAEQEFSIREERIREGMEITKKPNSIMVNEKWSLLGKSLYRLYKDLLLLETFAIMTYCSFSKILKKHDKVTGYNTRNAFMANVVNKANFTNYPMVLAMISRSKALYEEVSQHLISEGKEDLCEDERLFINMIHRLNAQVMDTREAEGAPDLKDGKDSRPSTLSNGIGTGTCNPSISKSTSCRVTSSLRLLLEENDAMEEAAKVSGAMSDNGDGDINVGSESTDAANGGSLEKMTSLTLICRKHRVNLQDKCELSSKRHKTE